MTVTSDSADYRATFYGILNAQGEFWSTMPFRSEDAARHHIREFWGRDTVTAERCLRKFKIVPVRVQLTSLELAPVGERPKGQDAERLGAQPADAIGEAEAPKTSAETHHED